MVVTYSYLWDRPRLPLLTRQERNKSSWAAFWIFISLNTRKDNYINALDGGQMTKGNGPSVFRVQTFYQASNTK